MSEGRTLRSVKNIYWGYLNTVINLILNFVNRTVFIRILGIEYLGINGLFSNILAMLSLADLGFSTAMAYSYYKPIAEDDKEKIAALNSFYRRIYYYIAAAIAVVGISLVPFLDRIVNLDRQIDHLEIYYVLTLAGTVSSYLLVYKSVLIAAYQKNYIVLKYNTLVKLFVTACQIIFMVLTKNYVVYLCVVVLGNFINNIRISMTADKMFPFIKSGAALNKEEQHKISQNIKSVFIYKVSSVLINGTDNILISALVGTIWVGYYSNYLIITNNLTTFINIAFRSLTASVGNLLVTENKEKRYELFKMVQTASFWFSTVVVPCVYVLADCFIIAWLGADFLLDRGTIAAITINLYLLCVLQPIWIYREATGLYKKTKYVMLITAVLNIFLSIWWGIYLGLSGILYASAAAKILTYVWYEPILLFREFFGKSAARFFEPLFINSAVVTLICIGLNALTLYIEIKGWAGFFVKGILCFGVCNVLYFLYFRKNEYFQGILKRMIRMLLNKNR